ncbi:hypothetical protein FSP39_020209 [Pinctada imbricata]|uniref:Tyr recombinase domain-containing protein n=1 Tax=Pinctada imbricata TaxID=66713 RepID=A0AA88XL10_PINIB|nr:hypothetical protein FSP39_020209 [Pinctada imbricata]
MRWKKWATSNQISERQCLPAKAIHVAIYLSSLVQNSQTPSPITQAFYGIRWAHSLISEPSPTDSELVRNVFEGAKRKLAHSVHKKEPITPLLLEKMFDSLYVENNLYNQRIICACLLSYSGFLRCSELLNLKTSDIIFHSSHMSIFIEKSKTDIYRDGNWLLIARTGTKLCPVVNLEKYFKFGNLDHSDLYLFRNIIKYAKGYIFRSSNSPMSYSRMRELFICAFSPFVSDIAKYGLHSLRAGGATSAANSGVPDRLFKRHGRWRSETAKDGYIKDLFDERLFVSKNLGI